MLTLTSEAAEAVRAMAVASPELPDDSGLRIAGQAQGDQVGLELAMVQAPFDDDEVVEEAGARIFIDPEVAPYLEDKTLDAAVVGNQVQFNVVTQA